MIRHVVELDPVEGRLPKGHGRQGRADLVADAHPEVVLPLGVRRDHEGAEKVLVLFGLVEQVPLGGPGPALLPVVDQPASGQEPAVEIVVIVTLLIGGQVRPVALEGIVGPLLPPPAVAVGGLLGQVPFLEGWNEGVRAQAGSRRVVDRPAALADSQEIPVARLGRAGLDAQRDREPDEDEDLGPACGRPGPHGARFGGLVHHSPAYTVMKVVLNSRPRSSFTDSPRSPAAMNSSQTRVYMMPNRVVRV